MKIMYGSIYSTDKERDIRKQNIMYWLCYVYDNTASNYKKQNDVIERIQENERFIERLEKKQLIEIKKIEIHQTIS